MLTVLGWLQPRSPGALLPVPWSERETGRRGPWERGWAGYRLILMHRVLARIISLVETINTPFLEIKIVVLLSSIAKSSQMLK